MSYLNPVRFHFAGRFRADVSTVNNNMAHFDDANFKPDFQKPFSNASDRSNWQPAGTGAWRLLNCTVTRAYNADGTAASTSSEDAAVDGQNWLRNIGPDGKPKPMGSAEVAMTLKAPPPGRPARFAASSPLRLDDFRHKPATST